MKVGNVWWNKKYFLSMMVMVLLLALVAHASEIEVIPLDNDIKVGEKASFHIKITNAADKTQRYSIYSLQSGQGWNVDPSPLKDKIVEIAPGKSYLVKIIAEPLEAFNPGIYPISVTIESDLGEEQVVKLKIYLSPENPPDYIPFIKATVDMDEKISPRDPLSIKLFMENKNPLNLENLRIRIQSDIPEFEKDVTVDLPPLEKKTVEFAITPNEFQQPKEYVLFFVFERNGEQVKVIEQKIEILPLLPAFTVTANEESVFLKKSTTVEVWNEGNVLNTQAVKIPVSFWQSIFTTGAKKIKEGEQRYLTWEVSLDANEKTTVVYVTNHRLFIYLLFVLLIFAAFYAYVQSPVFVQKTAVTTKSDEEGTLSEIKVTLEVKNKRAAPLKQLSIIDQVPAIANVEKSLHLGTLRPQEIKHTKQGTKVIWTLAELDAQEHRLITYKIRAKLNILGTFSLPRATVEYTTKSGKKKKAYSNLFSLNA